MVNTKDLRTGLTHQLWDKYLAPLKLRHGIYLVCWVSPHQRPAEWRRGLPADRDELISFLQDQAGRISGDAGVVPYILDISWPEAAWTPHEPE